MRRTERVVRCAEPKRGEAAAEPKPSSRWPFLRFVRTIAFFGFGRRSAKKDESSSVAPAIEVIFSADGSTPDSAQGAIMVAGATGGVGRRVVSQLLKRGDRVRALVRDDKKARELLLDATTTSGAAPGASLELVLGDVTQPKTLDPQAFAGVSSVVACTACKVAPKEGDTVDRAKYYQGTHDESAQRLDTRDTDPPPTPHRPPSPLPDAGIKFFDPEIVGDSPETVDFGGVRNLLAAACPNIELAMAGFAEGPVVCGSDAPPLAWGALDDVVMGGVSSSGMEAETPGPGGAGLVFRGCVSEQNNGGFASARTKNVDPPIDLGACSGLALRVRLDLPEDGGIGGAGAPTKRRFKCLLRTDAGFDAAAYSASFDVSPSAQWQQVVLPFDDFRCVFRAKTLTQGDDGFVPLDASKVKSLQVMLSKFEYDGDLSPHFAPGPFALSIDRIAGVLPSSKESEGGTGDGRAGARFVYVSSGGVTRVDRPGIDVDKEPPAVKMNAMLGGILTYKLKAEDAVRSCGVPFCVVRPCALTEEPGGMPLVSDQGDTLKGKVSREDVAALCIAALHRSDAEDVTFEVGSTVPFSQPWEGDLEEWGRGEERWDDLLSGIRQGVTGKTVNGVYTGRGREDGSGEEGEATLGGEKAPSMEEKTFEF